MKLPSRCIFSLITLFSTLPGHAQTEADTVFTIDSGLEIYIDYGKLATVLTEFETKLEVGIAVQLSNRLAPNFQVGYGSLQPNTAFENSVYESTGYYGRFGVNYLLPFDNVNHFFAGLKYGISFYEDEGTYEISSEIFDTYRVSFGEQDLTADWFEIILGSEKKLRVENLSLGGQFALRILNTRSKFTPIDTYAIPGYGRTLDKTVPAINLYLKYRF